MEMLVLFVIG